LRPARRAQRWRCLRPARIQRIRRTLRPPRPTTATLPRWPSDQFGSVAAVDLLRRSPGRQPSADRCDAAASLHAVGQFDDYIKAHPDQADQLRTIQAPLAAYKDRCGMQVSPTDALTVLADV
jgi:hypothetical protein